MRKIVLFLGASAVFGSSALADPPPVTSMAVECNWGRLTMELVDNQGFNQGQHASDPSGDGYGPGTADEPRAGLANVVEQGNLQALCELIESLISP